MGSRQRNRLAGDLKALPWQVSAVLAVGSFVGIRWVLPGFLPETGVLAGLVSILDPVSWLALCAFGFVAVSVAIREKLRGRPSAGPRPRQRMRQRATATADADTSTVPLSRHRLSEREHATLRPATWTPEALRVLEWKRFELLCARYYEAVGFRTETLAAGPDGGIDVKLFKVDPSKPLAIVQCKAWNTQQVGVKEIRELLGVMTHGQVTRGIFITTGSYTPDAIGFGAANPMQLLDGTAFCRKILELPDEKQRALLEWTFDGDYRTPTCASCGVKMVARDSRRGPFWGCTHYPRCKNMLQMRA